MPTRRSERPKEMVCWMDHFEAAKEVPIHTITLDVDSLDVTRWWRDFFVELGVLDEEDRVFDITQPFQYNIIPYHTYDLMYSIHHVACNVNNYFELTCIELP